MSKKRRNDFSEEQVLDVLRQHGAPEIDSRIVGERAIPFPRQRETPGTAQSLSALARAALLIFAVGLVGTASFLVGRGIETRQMVSAETELLIAQVLVPIDQGHYLQTIGKPISERPPERPQNGFPGRDSTQNTGTLTVRAVPDE